MLIKLIKNVEEGNSGEIKEVSKEVGERLISMRAARLIEELPEKKEEKKNTKKSK